eukprot:TRINITY_DN94007_c0_g1_i1.p1 TRINITY_DN94007_c0_g1~~TRINITY_DN94007_c0_g1_i1.p1  ORF type:complete len:326 (-),score=51.82 TRINITY_DN94007_c0_g1_i1:15-992(-)
MATCNRLRSVRRISVVVNLGTVILALYEVSSKETPLETYLSKPSAAFVEPRYSAFASAGTPMQPGSANLLNSGPPSSPNSKATALTANSGSSLAMLLGAALGMGISVQASMFGSRSKASVRRAAPFKVVKPEEMKPGRKIVFQHEGACTFNIPVAAAASMDDFMKEYAAEVCLQNLQRIEPKQGSPDVKLCYLEPNDVGPYRSQIRMEVQVEVVGSGKCDVNILEIIPGVVDKSTGRVTFDDKYMIDLTSDSNITWKDDGRGGLNIVNFSSSKSQMPLPWWFPMPDSVVQKVISFFIGQVVSAGHKKVNEQIKTRYAQWAAKESM